MKTKLTKKQIAKALDESKHGRLLKWSFADEHGICSYKYYKKQELIDICLQFGITLNNA